MNIRLRLANYITRYAPSHKKIIAYLTRKKTENPASLLTEIGYDEGLMCDIWMRSFLSLGKGEREMRQKLIKKDFPKEMIEEKIALIQNELYDWGSHRIQIQAQIRTLLERGKALRYIWTLLLGKYPYFREEIYAYIENTDDTDGLKKEVQKYKNKYNLSIPSDKQKFYAAIMRKGFSYRQIREEIERNEDED